MADTLPIGASWIGSSHPSSVQTRFVTRRLYAARGSRTKRNPGSRTGGRRFPLLNLWHAAGRVVGDPKRLPDFGDPTNQ